MFRDKYSTKTPLRYRFNKSVIESNINWGGSIANVLSRVETNLGSRNNNSFLDASSAVEPGSYRSQSPHVSHYSGRNSRMSTPMKFRTPIGGEATPSRGPSSSIPVKDDVLLYKPTKAFQKFHSEFSLKLQQLNMVHSRLVSVEAMAERCKAFEGSLAQSIKELAKTQILMESMDDEIYQSMGDGQSMKERYDEVSHQQSSLFLKDLTGLKNDQVKLKEDLRQLFEAVNQSLEAKLDGVQLINISEEVRDSFEEDEIRYTLESMIGDILDSKLKEYGKVANLEQRVTSLETFQGWALEEFKHRPGADSDDGKAADAIDPELLKELETNLDFKIKALGGQLKEIRRDLENDRDNQSDRFESFKEGLAKKLSSDPKPKNVDNERLERLSVQVQTLMADRSQTEELKLELRRQLDAKKERVTELKQEFNEEKEKREKQFKEMTFQVASLQTENEKLLLKLDQLQNLKDRESREYEGKLKKEKERYENLHRDYMSSTMVHTAQDEDSDRMDRDQRMIESDESNCEEIENVVETYSIGGGARGSAKKSDQEPEDYKEIEDQEFYAKQTRTGKDLYKSLELPFSEKLSQFDDDLRKSWEKSVTGGGSHASFRSFGTEKRDNVTESDVEAQAHKDDPRKSLDTFGVEDDGGFARSGSRERNTTEGLGESSQSYVNFFEESNTSIPDPSGKKKDEGKVNSARSLEREDEQESDPDFGDVAVKKEEKEDSPAKKNSSPRPLVLPGDDDSSQRSSKSPSYSFAQNETPDFEKRNEYKRDPVITNFKKLDFQEKQSQRYEPSGNDFFDDLDDLTRQSPISTQQSDVDKPTATGGRIATKSGLPLGAKTVIPPSTLSSILGTSSLVRDDDNYDDHQKKSTVEETKASDVTPQSVVEENKSSSVSGKEEAKINSFSVHGNDFDDGSEEYSEVEEDLSIGFDDDDFDDDDDLFKDNTTSNAKDYQKVSTPDAKKVNYVNRFAEGSKIDDIYKLTEENDTEP